MLKCLDKSNISLKDELIRYELMCNEIEFVSSLISNTYYLLDNGVIIGAIDALLVLDSCDILYLYIRSEYRGKGYSIKLLKEFIDYIKNKGVNSITLEVSSNNKIAKSLYEKIGFIYNGKRSEYYKDGSDALLYSLMVKK